MRVSNSTAVCSVQIYVGAYSHLHYVTHSSRCSRRSALLGWPGRRGTAAVGTPYRTAPPVSGRSL
jgi:hypothetical protein